MLIAVQVDPSMTRRLQVKVEGGVSCTLETQGRTNQVIFKLFEKGVVHLDWWTLTGGS